MITVLFCYYYQVLLLGARHGAPAPRGCAPRVGGCLLPGDVFSSPVAWGDPRDPSRARLVLGCRDDHIYGVEISAAAGPLLEQE